MFIFNYLEQRLKNREFQRFLRFSLVGLVGMGVNYFFLFVFYEIFNLYYLLSAAFAVEISVISNFILNNKWTFKDRRGLENAFMRFLKFNLVSMGGIGINLLILYILKENFGLGLYFANFFAILGAWFWNFFINNFWTWRKQKIN